MVALLIPECQSGVESLPDDVDLLDVLQVIVAVANALEHALSCRYRHKMGMVIFLSSV